MNLFTAAKSVLRHDPDFLVNMLRKKGGKEGKSKLLANFPLAFYTSAEFVTF